MIPFHVDFKPGAAIYEQVVYAAKKAMMAGQLRPGDAFPSVRTISRELKINPNTAHKVITHLVLSGLLEIRSGAGTFVANRPQASRAEKTQLLERQVEQLGCGTSFRRWRIVVSPAKWHATLLPPSLYVIDFRRALNCGEAQGLRRTA